MADPLIVSGHEIKTLITPEQANWQDSVHGEDEYGEYVACRLGNRNGAAMYNWYVFISPKALSLMQDYNWCGNVNNHCISIRRRENIDGKQCSFFLNKEVWHLFNGETPLNIYHWGHPLDFRIQKLSTCRKHDGCRGIVWHKNGKCWQVQITIQGTARYIGIAPYPEEGYRMYNRALRDIKKQHPYNQHIQKMLYNTVIPRF